MREWGRGKKPLLLALSRLIKIFMKFKDQNIIAKIFIVLFWLAVAAILCWPAVIVIAIVLGILLAILAAVFIVGLACLPFAIVAWLLTRS